MTRRSFIPFAALAAGLSALLATTGCESSDDDFDHDPPAGQGSIIIDNYSYTDIEFYLDGKRLGKIDSDDDRAFDLAPGAYRVVLNDEDDQRNWADNVDVLEGRLTVLTVRIDAANYYGYSVIREIE